MCKSLRDLFDFKTMASSASQNPETRQGFNRNSSFLTPHSSFFSPHSLRSSSVSMSRASSSAFIDDMPSSRPIEKKVLTSDEPP